MPDEFFIARLFLLGGAALAFAGLVLWFALPISSPLPPFVLTPLLALGYGAVCWRQQRARKP